MNIDPRLHRRARPPARLLVLSFAALACSDPAAPNDPNDPVDPDAPVDLALEVVAQGLASPLYLTAPRGDDRLFVVERGGRIRIIEGGTVLGTPFLDVGGQIVDGGEQGLLGLAFHPQYAANGHFYVNYTDRSGDTRVVRYNVSADPNVADATSALPILTVGQPFGNHNGGMIEFGPDGMLYVGMGDGGSGGDPQDHGQRPETLLGSMLRLDVDGGAPYAIPADNPFVGHPTTREETWAYGLRNPWRFSFDRGTGDLYIGDVGQNAVEEVSFQPSGSPGGENYGWRITEGTACYDPPSGCSSAGLTPPIHEYGHDEGCSITGGYVYRGSALPDLVGRYFFADFCSTWIRSFVVVNGTAQGVQDHSPDVGPVASISSFGEDGNGELYVVSLGGTVYRVAAAGGP
ncbi:MAG TPA: PQQ-dependent sugar dehydrogenase [Longimicrobiales bacterium]|nr:PQQ-dependent sugar dehydrogenase [Longimicrobiales bacterium]